MQSSISVRIEEQSTERVALISNIIAPLFIHKHYMFLYKHVDRIKATPILAARLRDAMAGGPDGSKWRVPTAEAINELCAQSAFPAPTSESDKEVAFQKLAYNRFVEL